MAVRVAESASDLATKLRATAELATWRLLWTLELLASSLYIQHSSAQVLVLLAPRRRLGSFKQSEQNLFAL